MNDQSMGTVIDIIFGLLNESEKKAEKAACGYDEGWYNGEANAYETVLKIFKEVAK